jgi:hypothetical protein
MAHHKSHEKKSQEKKHLVEKLFKLLLLTLVVLRILNHFNLKFPVAPLMKGVEVLMLSVWSLLVLKDKNSQAELRAMMIQQYNPFGAH